MGQRSCRFLTTLCALYSLCSIELLGGEGGVGCSGYCLDIHYVKVLYHGSANVAYNLHIPLQILRRTSLARFCPVVYLSSAYYTQQPTPVFSLKAT